MPNLTIYTIRSLLAKESNSGKQITIKTKQNNKSGLP